MSLEDDMNEEMVRRTRNGEDFRQVHAEMLSRGLGDQVSARSRDAATHAANWHSKTNHLFDDSQNEAMSKIVEYAQRGMIISDEVNRKMTEISKGVFPLWEPDASTRLNIPPHLGEQFF